MINIRIRSLALFSISLLMVFKAPAKDFYFVHYDKESGLCHQNIQCAMQDHNGFMWFGTRAGLSRFDGSRFINYYPDVDNLYALPDYSIQRLLEAPDGTIWINHSSGICTFNPVTDKFFIEDIDQLNNNSNLRLYAVDVDGYVWGSSDKGFFCLDSFTRRLISFNVGGNLRIRSVLPLQDGSVWITCSDGTLRHFDKERGELVSYDLLSRQERERNIIINHLVLYDEGKIAVSTDQLGVKLIDIASGQVSSLFETGADGAPIFIHTMLQTANGDLWLGTENGIHIFSPSQGFTDHLQKSDRNKYSLSDNSIHMLYQDRDMGIWAGSYFRGVDYLSYDNDLFNKYFPVNNTGSQSGNVIREIVQSADGKLWIGSEDGGLNVLDPESGVFKNIEGLSWKGNPFPSNIQSLLFYDPTHLWVGTYINGIFVLNTETMEVEESYGSNNPDSGITSSIVTIKRLSNGVILVATRNGLYVFHPQTNSFSLIPDTSGMIRSIFEDRNHLVWLGFIDRGIATLDISSDNSTPEVKTVPFIYPRITSFYEDSSGSFWIATEGMGVFQFDRTDGSYKQILPKNDYPGIIAYQMMEDSMETIWISTSDGLFQYNINAGITHRFSVANGLPNNQFDYNSCYKDDNGIIYMGTVNGLLSFSPERVLSVHNYPKVFITGFNLTGSDSTSFKRSPLMKESILYTKELTLKHNQNTYSIDYASPCYSINRNIWYRYKMDNLDKNWTIVYEPERLYYTMLRPGKYTLNVQASSDRNNWDGEISTLEITIKPPFWNTLLARILYCLIILGTAIWIILLSQRKMRIKEEERLEKVKSQKDAEALRTMITFFTNITHEIRTPLTLIIGSLKRLKESFDTQTAPKQDLGLMEKQTKRLHDLVNQLLDFRKIESAAYKMNYSRVDINMFTKDLCATFSPTIENKNINLTFDIPDRCYYITADIDALTKIIGNLLSNAFKYCQKYVSVSLSEYTEDGSASIRLRINNDGDRLPDNISEDIFTPFYQYSGNGKSVISSGTGLGLSLAKSLAEMHNGVLYFDKERTDCNSFVLEMPMEMTKEEVGEANEDKVMDVLPDRTAVDKSLKDNDTNESLPLILLVEDEEDMRSFIKDELSNNFNILEASNGKEALEIIENNNVSLVVSDLMMPVIDGLELCKSIKTDLNHCHIPVIVLTAKVSQQTHIDALESRADAFIEKPFSTDHLIAQITNLLANRDLMRATFSNSPYANVSAIASNPIDEAFLKELNDFVMNNLSNKNLSVEAVAAHMNMSISTLFRKIKATTSMSPLDFIRLCRLKKAAELLNEGGRKISDIAERVGINSPSYFTSCFMKQFGITPSEFAKRHKKDDQK